MTLTTHWTEISQLSASDRETAWQGFIERYRGFVGAMLRRTIWPTARARDAADEFWAFLFAGDVLAGLQPPIRFRAFLGGVLRNYSRDWHRRNRPHGHAVVDEGHAADEPTLAEREELILWGHQLLHLALQRLERTQPRWALALRRFHGIGDDALAEAPPRIGAWALATELGLTTNALNALNALHQLLFRARRGLRECLMEEVRHTVSTRPDLRDELAKVFAALHTALPGILEDPA